MNTVMSTHTNCTCRRSAITGKLPNPCLQSKEWKAQLEPYRKAVLAGFYTDEVKK